MKDDLLYLIHMVEYGRKIQARIMDLSQDRFDADETLRLALAHLIQVIGEAACRVSPATRTALPAVPWLQITGMRHRIVHDYFHVNDAVVWETATRSIPELLALLEPYVNERLKEQGRNERPQ